MTDDEAAALRGQYESLLEQHDAVKASLSLATTELAFVRRSLLATEDRLAELEDLEEIVDELPDKLDNAHRLLGLDRAAPIDRWMTRQGRYEPPRSAAWR
jgi:hypothetical protein